MIKKFSQVRCFKSMVALSDKSRITKIYRNGRVESYCHRYWEKAVF